MPAFLRKSVLIAHFPAKWCISLKMNCLGSHSSFYQLRWGYSWEFSSPSKEVPLPPNTGIFSSFKKNLLVVTQLQPTSMWEQLSGPRQMQLPGSHPTRRRSTRQKNQLLSQGSKILRWRKGYTLHSHGQIPKLLVHENSKPAFSGYIQYRGIAFPQTSCFPCNANSSFPLRHVSEPNGLGLGKNNLKIKVNTIGNVEERRLKHAPYFPLILQ